MTVLVAPVSSPMVGEEAWGQAVGPGRGRAIEPAARVGPWLGRGGQLALVSTRRSLGSLGGVQHD